MADKYTNYPDHLKRRIEAVEAFMSDVPKFRAWWETLPDEERQRLDALSPEERQAEIAKLRGVPGSDPNPPADGGPAGDGDTIEVLKQKLEKADQRYRTLQGMIKDPAELEKQNNFLLQQIKFLQDQIHDLQTKSKAEIKPAETKPEPAKKINVREVLKTHYDSLGEDLAPEILEKEMAKDESLFELARETFEKAADQRISEVVTKFDGQFKLSKEQQFYKDLDDWGDWRKMWPTPEWQAFLADEADVTGVDRYTIIADAFNRMDSRVVLKAFEKFTGKGKGVPAPNKGNLDGDKIKNRLGAPRSSGASLPGPDTTTPQMSPLQARKALADLAANYSRGLFKGNKDEYDKEYARLFALAKGGTG